MIFRWGNELRNCPQPPERAKLRGRLRAERQGKATKNPRDRYRAGSRIRIPLSLGLLRRVINAISRRRKAKRRSG